MARRRKRYGSPPGEHSKRADRAVEKSMENAKRAIYLGMKGTCGHAAGALASAEYWRGRADAEGEGAGGFVGRPSMGTLVGRAHDAVSRCISRKA